MAIRLRKIGEEWVALCAARSVEKPGDVYLDDGQHHALSLKFSQDFNSENCWPLAENPEDNRKREIEESNNPAREWWDKMFGIPAAICNDYTRPKGVLGGPCLNCGGSQPEHVKPLTEVVEVLPPSRVD